MTKKQMSTYDELVNRMTAKEKKEFEKEYQELLLSELLIALMNEDEISVRKLAQAADISPTIIQSIRSGKKDNLTVQSFLKIINALGYLIVLERPSRKGSDKNRIVLQGSVTESSRKNSR